MPITAEKHNETRRAAKRKQKAAAQARAKNNPRSGRSGDSIIEAANKERQRRDKINERKEANRKRLLDELTNNGTLILSPPKIDDYDITDDNEYDSYDYAIKRFNWDVRDLKDAIRQSRDEKSSVKYGWINTPKGGVIFSVQRRQKKAA